MKKSGFGIAMLLVPLLMAGYLFAGEIRIVEGLIEDTGKNLIKVRGRHYDVSAIPIMNPSGEAVRMTELERGQRVEIFFENKVIVSIVVHDANMVQ